MPLDARPSPLPQLIAAVTPDQIQRTGDCNEAHRRWRALIVATVEAVYDARLAMAGRDDEALGEALARTALNVMRAGGRLIVYALGDQPALIAAYLNQDKSRVGFDCVADAVFPGNISADPAEDAGDIALALVEEMVDQEWLLLSGAWHDALRLRHQHEPRELAALAHEFDIWPAHQGDSDAPSVLALLKRAGRADIVEAVIAAMRRQSRRDAAEWERRAAR